MYFKFLKKYRYNKNMKILKFTWFVSQILKTTFKKKNLNCLLTAYLINSKLKHKNKKIKKKLLDFQPNRPKSRCKIEIRHYFVTI